MECYKHPGREATGVCTTCGKAVCEECSVTVQGKNQCKECVEKGAVPVSQKLTHIAGRPVAGIGQRFAALLLDGIIMVLIWFLISLISFLTFTAGARFNPFAAVTIVWAYVAFTLLLSYGYFIILEAMGGQTLGKKLVGIKVIKDNGKDIGWGESIVRNVLRIVDGFFFYIVGLILVAVSVKSQRLGDIVGGTVVVQV